MAIAQNMRITLSIGLMALLLLSSGCKLFRKGQKEDKQARLLREIVTETQNENLDFENLYLNGKLKLNMPEGDFSKITVDYRVYMQKDEAILVRVKKFLEVGKLYIDKDSVYLVNKLNKELTVVPINQMNEVLGFQANFEILEDILLGNLNLFGQEFGSLQSQNMEENPVVLSGNFQGSDLTYKIDTEIHKLLSLLVKDSTRNAEARLAYGSFSEVGNAKVPNLMKIEVQAPQEASAEFDHKRIELNKENFKINFEVPQNYERVSF